MSWGVHAQGKVRAVEKAIEQQFADMPPMTNADEEAQRQSARKLIASSLKSVADSKAVVVNAHGSMSQNHPLPAEGEVGGCTYSFNVSIQPMFGFVE